MTPPINIDGDTVDAITIDGTSVTEVTVDGTQVFGIPDSVLTQDLLAWYRFEDGDARDYASNAEFPNITWGDSTAFDGTVDGATFQANGGVTDFENGSNSGAFDFDGSDDTIDLNSSIVDAGADYTVCLYVKSNVSNSDPLRNIAFSSGHTNNHDELSINSTVVGSFDGNRISVTVNADDGNFHHLACANDNGTHNVFKDGQFVGSFTNSLNSDNGITNSIGGRLLQSNSNFSNRFTGFIDDVRLYNRALTASEISDIYNTTEP